MPATTFNLSETRLSQSQLRIIVVCFVIAMVDGFDTLMLSYIAPLLGKAWQLEHHEIGLMFGIGYLGAVFGGFGLGTVSDRLGRKKALLTCLAFITVFTLLGVQASSPGELLIYRFFAGVGLGGAIPCITALTAEQAPAERRSAMVTRMFLGFPIGALLGGALTAWLLTRFDWPVVFWVGGIASLVCIGLVILLVPESLPTTDTPSRSPFGTLALQFADGRRAAALLLWLAAVNVMTVTYFMVSWTPTVLSLTGLDVHHADSASLSVHLGGICGALLMAGVAGRRGPFASAGKFLLGGAVVVAALGWCLGSTALAVGAFFFAGFGVIGGQLFLPAMAARLFPSGVRGAGVGALMGVGRIGSIAGPMIGGLLLSLQLPWTTLYLIAAVPVTIAALAVLGAEKLRPRDEGAAH